MVTPDNGILDVGKSMQIDVSFDPQKTGSHASHLVVSYETGKKNPYILSLIFQLNFCMIFSK